MDALSSHQPEQPHPGLMDPHRAQEALTVRSSSIRGLDGLVGEFEQAAQASQSEAAPRKGLRKG